MTLILRILPALIFWGIFGYVILYVPYPKSITQADVVQLSSFFISLFLALIFSFNFFLKSFALSGSLALGIIFLLILKALNSFNLVTVSLIILAIGLLFSYFRKSRSLTNASQLILGIKVNKAHYLFI